MTTTLITIQVIACDFAGCTARVESEPSTHLVQPRPEGWTNTAYTHGCPDHAEAITAHQAKITNQTRGRGYKEKTTYFLACTCGWRPMPSYQTYNSDWLRKEHLAHVQRVTAKLEATT